jgi:hypothetical protein
VFSIFKKRKTTVTAEDLPAQNAAATEEIKAKWVSFHNTVHFNADVPLSEKIDAFVTPVHIFFEKSYPVLAAGPAQAFWLSVFTAILESKTHPTEQVNAAIAELRTKYVKG